MVEDKHRRELMMDRLTNLPDELLIQILSLIPTKDAAVTQAVSKRMQQAFTWTTTLDFDDHPVSFCLGCPHLVERFPLFESFIDNILQKFSQSKHTLTRFRLSLGGDKAKYFQPNYSQHHHCNELCFPNLNPNNRLFTWISYPLTHRSLTELDLYFHVKFPYQCNLPPALFTCQSLQKLKIDSNLEIVDASEFPVISLPNLKLLYLKSLVFGQDDLINRLFFGCSSLEDVSITYCSWEKLEHLIIWCKFLRRLVLDIWRSDAEENKTHLVVIDAPNLEYFDYDDNLALSYQVTDMNVLVTARVKILDMLEGYMLETYVRSQLSLVRALSAVKHLSLLGNSVENVYLFRELNDPLPVFRNLRTLELDSFYHARWDILLLLILHSSPCLETLIFPKSVVFTTCPRPQEREAMALEAGGWKTVQTVPSCFQTHLKHIELQRFVGIDRELNMIIFFLRKVSVLKELIITLSTGTCASYYDRVRLQSLLEQVSWASDSCSVMIQ